MKIYFGTLICLTGTVLSQSFDFSDDAQLLMNNFKVNFEGHPDDGNFNTTTHRSSFNNTDSTYWNQINGMLHATGPQTSGKGGYGWNGTAFGLFKNKNLNKVAQPSCKEVESQIRKLSRQFFPNYKDPMLNAQGQPITYFKDNSSVPVMFRKIIPPRTGQLPVLHFQFNQDNNTCRCLCKL